MPRSSDFSVLGRVPAPALFAASGIFQYSGAAIAVSLFALMSPAGVTWWRLATGAVTLLILARPWKQEWTWKSLAAAAIFGLFIGSMNFLFYEAIARLPLGVAVSIEFLGPVSVAIFRGRGWATKVAALLALAGIVTIGGLGVDLSAPGLLLGVAFALGAAAMWAGYILVGQKIASQRSGISSLAIGCLVATVVFAPFFAQAAFSVDFSPSLLWAVVGVGVLSTTIPYSFESVALRRLSAPLFALLTALLPATSTVVGAVVLRQIPTPAELCGLVLVSIAVWLASRAE